MVLGRKKGQLTPIALVGLVILAIVILLFFLRDQIGLPVLGGGTPRERMQAVEKHIEDCISKIGDEPIRRIGLQGGHLALADDTYRLDQGTPISYLCYNIAGSPRCSNRLLLKVDMEKELAGVLQNELRKCVNVKKVAKGMTVQEGDPVVQVGISQDIVDVIVKKQITLSNDQDSVSKDTFSHAFSYPLGRLYEVGQDILGVESTLGEFEQLSYMLAHRGQYLIEKKKPYPDKLYLMQVRDNDYLFQFFVQGEPS